MPAIWGLVPNHLLNLTADGSLPAALPGAYPAPAPSGSLRIDEGHSLVITGETLDTIRAFCLAHGSVQLTVAGRLPSFCVTTEDAPIRSVVVGYRSDLAQTFFAGHTLAEVGFAAGR